MWGSLFLFSHYAKTTEPLLMELSLFVSIENNMVIKIGLRIFLKKNKDNKDIMGKFKKNTTPNIKLCTLILSARALLISKKVFSLVVIN